jgi:RHS repeat-associated protein
VTGEIANVFDFATGKAVFSADYDPAGRLKQIGSSNYLGANSLQVALDFDSFGRKKSQTHSTGLSGNFSYDLLNRITAITHDGAATPGGPAEHFSEVLIYNPLTGTIDQVMREEGTFNFSFDSMNWLTGSSFMPAASGVSSLPTNLLNRTWQYTLDGNRATDSLHGAGRFLANFETEDSKTKFVADLDGLGQMAQRIDKTSAATRTMSYRVDGLLKHFESSEVSVNYLHDALGRRIGKSVNTGSESFSQSLSYLGDGRQVLIGKSGSGDVSLYLDRLGSDSVDDEHLAEISSSAGAKAYMPDHLGSIINTEAAGDARTFSPWGESLGSIASLSGVTAPITFGFAGMKLDRESGQYAPDWRQYSPDLGRFTGKDPLGFAGGDRNLYRYGASDPTINTDAKGTGPLLGTACGVQSGKYFGDQANKYTALRDKALDLIDMQIGEQTQLKALALLKNPGCDTGKFDQKLDELRNLQVKVNRLYLGVAVANNTEYYVASQFCILLGSIPGI